MTNLCDKCGFFGLSKIRRTASRIELGALLRVTQGGELTPQDIGLIGVYVRMYDDRINPVDAP